MNIRQTGLKSAQLIQKYDLKNRSKHKFFPTLIIDNFFDEPELWHHFALTQNYDLEKNCLFPCMRTQPLNTINENIFSSFARTLLNKVSLFKNLNYINAHFHSVDKTYDKGWVHDDDPTTTATGVIFLNPTAPLHTGTTIYKDKVDALAEKFMSHIENDMLNFSAEERQQLNNLREEQRNTFEIDIQVENVFNRCVLFDPRVWHSADNFFGTTIEDSRLTLVFYVTAE